MMIGDGITNPGCLFSADPIAKFVWSRLCFEFAIPRAIPRFIKPIPLDVIALL